MNRKSLRAAAASLLSLKAGGITPEVVTCVKRSPGIVEVGLGIGDESRLREAEAAFTSVPDPKVGRGGRCLLFLNDAMF